MGDILKAKILKPSPPKIKTETRTEIKKPQVQQVQEPPPKKNKRAITFEDDESLHLLMLWAREDIQKRFENIKKHDVVYNELAEEHNRAGYNRDGKEVKNKVCNLRKLYHNLKPTSGGYPTKHKLWPFLHQVLGQKDSDNTDNDQTLPDENSQISDVPENGTDTDTTQAYHAICPSVTTVVKFPPFLQNHPDIWLEQIEAFFYVLKIVSDEEKYRYFIVNAESSVVTSVADIIRSQDFYDNAAKYEAIKKEITRPYVCLE